MTQFFYLCLSFNFMPKNGKHFVKFVKILFKTTLNKDQGIVPSIIMSRIHTPNLKRPYIILNE